MARIIFHVDMDAFFAAVEQREHPEYRKRPLIIGGLAGRGVVSTCSYEARRFGVHSAMPMTEARRRCPEAIFLEGNYPLYIAASREVFAIFHAFAPLVEPLSIDEAFLDVTGMEHFFGGTALDYARSLKEKIREKTGLVASVGIAPNKFLAKIASDMEKPDGLTVVGASEREIRAFLWPLDVRRIWGVGAKTAERLRRLHVNTVEDLARLPLDTLRKNFGEKTAPQLHALAFGIDERPVHPREEAKSIGKEETFPQDLHTEEEIRHALSVLAEQVGWRLRRAGKRARTIQLKVRRGDFKTWTRSKTLGEATSFDDVLYRTALSLFHVLKPTGGIRLLGISGSNFDEDIEISLFPEEKSEKKEQLYTAIDALKARFGEGVIRRGRAQSVEPPAKNRQQQDGDGTV